MTTVSQNALLIELKRISDELEVMTKKLDEINSSDNSTDVKISISPVEFFIVILILIIAVDFWIQTVHRMIKTHATDGETPSWVVTAMFALLFTMIFVMVVIFLDLPMTIVEDIGV